MQRIASLGIVVLLVTLFFASPEAAANGGNDCPPSSVAGRCEDRCIEQYDRDEADCRRLPKNRRQACFNEAMRRLANCMAKCPDRSKNGCKK